MILRDNGHAMAAAAGRQLGALLAELPAGAPRHVTVAHSTVQRCAQTGHGIAQGLSAHAVDVQHAGASAAFASPFLLDVPKAYALIKQTGPTFIRAWFDGAFPPDVFMPRGPAARAHLHALDPHLRPAEGAPPLTIVVSHDWNVALLKEELLGLRPEQRWPGFLEGIVVARAADDALHVATEEATVRLPPTAPAPAPSRVLR